MSEGEEIPESTPTCLAPPISIPETLSPAIHPKKVIIGHRGSPQFLPEHTLEGYRMALGMGADYIEPDLVPTSDGELVALHSLDLNKTTNVMDVFPNKAPTFSNYMNRTGYWTYDFTVQELKQLKVHQRFMTPVAPVSDSVVDEVVDVRSHAFDGLFEIPTLTEILELVVEWQDRIVPALDGEPETPRRKAGPGIYAELKDTSWLIQDVPAAKDLEYEYLSQLLLQHLDQHYDLWDSAILARLCNTKVIKQGEYDLPPLIVQSFEPKALEAFRKVWAERQTVDDTPANNQDDEAEGEDPDELDTTNSTEIPNTPTAPTTTPQDPNKKPIPGDIIPPCIWLVSKSKCQDDEELETMWFQLGEEYRDTIQGLGVDKACLHPLSAGRDFVEEAAKWELAVHPYTIKPEASSRLPVESGGQWPIETELEELLYLFCEVQVHGIFTESIPSALQAASQVCPGAEDLAKNLGPDCPTVPTTSHNVDSNDKSVVPKLLLPWMGVSFVLGIVATLFAFQALARWSTKNRGQVVALDEEDAMGGGGGGDPSGMVVEAHKSRRNGVEIGNGGDDIFVDETDDELL